MSQDSSTDSSLLEAARQGDRAALGQLLEQHQDRVFSFGMKMCGDTEDARDVAQETMLAMVRGVKEFRGESTLSTWLYTVARSFCIKKRRRTKGAPDHHESLDAAPHEPTSENAPTPEQAMITTEARLHVARALDDLEPEAREVIILRDIEGLTAPEVGEVTGLSVAAVKSRLHRARAALRERLAPLLNEAAVAPGTPQCPDVLTLLSQKLENEISPDLCAQMESHVEGCQHCKGLCDSLKHSLAVCRSLPTPKVPGHVRDSLRAAVSAALAKQE